MKRLDVAPEVHFDDADYAGSEVLIYHWNSDARRVLVCCQDLSEKIADWAYGTGRPDYASRYRIFCFLDVGGYTAAPAPDASLATYARRLPDHPGGPSTPDRRHHRLGYRRPLHRGHLLRARLRGGDLRLPGDPISEKTTNAATGSDGTSRYVVDAENGIPFDEDEFLSGLYGSESGRPDPSVDIR